MKKGTKKIISVLMAITCFCSILLAGCCEKKPDPMSTCILLGNTKNVRAPGANLFAAELSDIIDVRSDFSVIVLDGSPKEQALSGELKAPLIPILEPKEDYIQMLIEDIENCLPTEDEIDILAGLQSAATQIDASRETKCLLIYSSGISTTGELNFVKNPELLYEDADKVVALLSAALSGIDLSGVQVVWYGLGDVADEQSPLNAYSTVCLKTIWTKILLQCNVNENDIIFKEYINDDANINTNNNTDAFEDFNKSAESVNRDAFPHVSAAKFRGYINITEDQIQFKAGSSEIINTAEAEEVIRQYAEQIKKVGTQKIYVVGCTADAGTEKQCADRGLMRAQAIKDLLCKYGVPESSLEPIGLGKYMIDGPNSEWRVDDSTGVEEKRKQNRKVMLIYADSEEGHRFMEQWTEFKKN